MYIHIIKLIINNSLYDCVFTSNNKVKHIIIKLWLRIFLSRRGHCHYSVDYEAWLTIHWKVKQWRWNRLVNTMWALLPNASGGVCDGRELLYAGVGHHHVFVMAESYSMQEVVTTTCLWWQRVTICRSWSPPRVCDGSELLYGGSSPHHVFVHGVGWERLGHTLTVAGLFLFRPLEALLRHLRQRRESGSRQRNNSIANLFGKVRLVHSKRRPSYIKSF